MRFEFDWDPAKAESNRRKHGVAFADAPRVAADPWPCRDLMKILAKGRSDGLP